MTIPDSQAWQRLSPLLDELWELTPGEREARLEALRQTDPELATELEAWLTDAGRADAAQFLSGVAASPVDAREAAPSLAGTRLGAWVLEAPLGEGGMGAVWQARRADGRFEGLAAVKLLHLSLVGAAGTRRFEREGAILARLSHPNIARLLDAGVSPSGQPYLVLELVHGERIDRWCDARRLGVDARVALFRSVLGAVAHAHRHLVIHRDIKPGNILVSGDGVVKLLDFGIAKLLQGEQDDAVTDLTGALRGVLTPDHAAPEQLRGEAITTASDVYTLGILLYELLTGRHPTGPRSATAADLLRTTLEGEPLPLASAVAAGRETAPGDLVAIAAARDTSIGRLQRQLRGDLEIIVAKALRKAPSERYATVDAFDDDLRRWSTGEPIAARAPSLGYRAACFVARHRAAVAGGALTFVAIVAGLVGTFTEARRAEEQAAQAKVERDNALRDLAFAGAANDLVSFLVSQSNATPLTASQLLARAEQLADRQFADDPLSRGRLQLMLGIEYGNVLESEKSKAVLLRAQASARSASSPGLLSNVDCLLASTYGDQNEAQRALALFGEAIERLRAQADPDNSVLAACLHMRADLHAQTGKPQAMLDDAQAALAALGTPLPHQRVMANSIRMVVAEAYGRLGKTAQAIDAYERSLADLASMGRQRTARTVLRYNNFSRMLFVAGQPLRAEDMAARGLSISRGLSGNGELDAILEGNRAHALVELGRFDEAKALTELALASADERKDLRWGGMFALYGAPAWCGTGDLTRCASLLATAREKLTATLPPGHSMFGALELLAARLALAEPQRDAARDHLLRAVALFDAASDKTPLRIEALALLAGEERRRGNAAEAVRHATLAMAQARDASQGLAYSEWLGQALVAQGIAQEAQGEREAARATLAAALEQLRKAAGEQAPATREAIALLAAS
ncbi:MAG: protein kinase domain-containing protein [Caldimonas sp.]